MKTREQILNALPAPRRAKITARTQQLIAEEHALRRLREARKLTQQRMGELLGIRQDSVSRIEKRSDLLLSTLKSYVQAMGGDLRLVAEFKDGCVALSGLGEAAEEQIGTKPSERARPVEVARPVKRQHLGVVQAK
jgi:transcriptional regulator with XRE-family HTH domain